MTGYLSPIPAEIVERNPRLRPLVLTCLVLVAAIVGLLMWPVERLMPVAADALPPVAEPALRLEARAPDTALTVSMPSAPTVAPELATVSRAAMTLFGIPPLPEDRPVSRILRKPVRLSERGIRHQTATDVARSALLSLDATDPRLLHVLSHALETGKSNAYIDALLNGALSRGEVALPPALLTPGGAVDTNRILSAVLQGAGY